MKKDAVFSLIDEEGYIVKPRRAGKTSHTLLIGHCHSTQEIASSWKNYLFEIA